MDQNKYCRVSFRPNNIISRDRMKMIINNHHKATPAIRMMKFCSLVLLIASVALTTTMTSVYGFTMPSARNVLVKNHHRFASPATTATATSSVTSLNMMVVDPQVVVDTVGFVSDTSSSTMMIAETEAWVQPTALFLGPFLNFMSFAMVRTFVCGKNVSSRCPVEVVLCVFLVLW